MLTNDFQGLALSRLGFGAMRLPLLPGRKEPTAIDEAQVDAMVDYAMAHGVNYFDTAHPYHGGLSERVLGRSLARYPRQSWYLADKYPGHQIAQRYDPAAIFEEQLERCGVDYFDFYLLHNVYENSIQVYMDPQWGILDYFVEQKRLGRIKHLGFSCHGGLPTLARFLDYCGDKMEFCQLQLNYLDWTLQQGREKYDLLTARGIPVWVMEPIRGGRLAALTGGQMDALRRLRPQDSAAAWALRFLQGLPNVKMILSGMSDLEQMVENVDTFTQDRPLTEAETAALLELAEGMKDAVPCTACRYCCDGCPMGLDIPAMIAACNEARFALSSNVRMRFDALPEDKRPAACIACGKCSRTCPQGIDVPAVLKELAQAIEKIPDWAQVCREREEEARKSRS
ncbi:MAG: oxidoreductase [Oscillospiraceae bacterium]|nr:oxidoreductase [Oscillospiraceae bacterium]MCI9308347.1 oxidoreductase [Oscillospiraceae bacterium]MCI9548456.1 oxidoreductase [Oscillospiraceae bacterium]